MSREDRTCEIIEKGGVILLKLKSGWYLQQHTSLAAGYDSAVWGWRPAAMQFHELDWAFIVAKQYECKVVVWYPERAKKQPNLPGFTIEEPDDDWPGDT